MEFKTEFVDRTRDPVDEERLIRYKYTGYYITINPHIPFSENHPDIESFKQYFFQKLKIFFSEKVASRYITYKGNVKWSDITCIVRTTIEYGMRNKCIHAHTWFYMKIPAIRGNVVGIDYSRETGQFYPVLYEVFKEIPGIYADIKPINCSAYNIEEYNRKKELVNILYRSRNFYSDREREGRLVSTSSSRLKETGL